MKNTYEDGNSPFKEVRSTNESLKLSKNDLPWIKTTDKLDVPLVYVITNYGQPFYFGNAVRGEMIDLMQNFFDRDAKSNESVNRSVYSRLPGFLNNDRQDVKTIQKPKTLKPIYYFSKKDGMRVYFMRFTNEENIPIILRIGACTDKNQERKIMAVISNDATRKL